MAVGWKITRQNPIFPPHSASIRFHSACIPLTFRLHSTSIRFHPFSHHFSGRDVVSRATGSGIVACKNSVKPGSPDLTALSVNDYFLWPLLQGPGSAGDFHSAPYPV